MSLLVRSQNTTRQYYSWVFMCLSNLYFVFMSVLQIINVLCIFLSPPNRFHYWRSLHMINMSNKFSLCGLSGFSWIAICYCIQCTEMAWQFVKVFYVSPNILHFGILLHSIYRQKSHFVTWQFLFDPQFFDTWWKCIFLAIVRLINR